MSLPPGFWDSVDRTTVDGCWLWTGTVDGSGHGLAKVAEQGWPERAHRLVYAAEVGPIPAGHVVHHRCRVPACVNPAHLEAMSPGDHTRLHRRSGRRGVEVG